MTLHQIVTQARLVPCACGATPGKPCSCGPCGVHYARLTRARRADLIEAEDFAAAIHDGDVVTGYGVLLDPEVVGA